MNARRHRVLVVDDEPLQRKAMRALLNYDGFDVTTASDGSSALALLGAGPPPDVILFDWRMAPMSGGEFLSVLESRPSLRGIPRIVVTAYPDLAISGTETVTKPVNVEQLVARVRELIAEREAAPKVSQRAERLARGFRRLAIIAASATALIELLRAIFESLKRHR